MGDKQWPKCREEGCEGSLDVRIKYTVEAVYEVQVMTDDPQGGEKTDDHGDKYVKLVVAKHPHEEEEAEHEFEVFCEECEETYDGIEVTEYERSLTI